MLGCHKPFNIVKATAITSVSKVFFRFISLLLICICTPHVYRYSQRLEEGARYPGGGATGGCELSNGGTVNQNGVL